MTYTFARAGVVVALVEDYFPGKNAGGCGSTKENGKLNEMPCHHKLEQYLDAYITAPGVARDRKGPLFRSAIGKTGQLTDRPMLRGDVEHGAPPRVRGGRIEVAQAHGRAFKRENHGRYDRRSDDISVGEVERIGI